MLWVSRKRRAISDADGSRSVGKETRQNGFHVSIPIFDEESHGTVRDGALEIAFKKSAGELGPDFLAEIRNRGGRFGEDLRNQGAPQARKLLRGHGI